MSSGKQAGWKSNPNGRLATEKHKPKSVNQSVSRPGRRPKKGYEPGAAGDLNHPQDSHPNAADAFATLCSAWIRSTYCTKSGCDKYSARKLAHSLCKSGLAIILFGSPSQTATPISLNTHSSRGSTPRSRDSGTSKDRVSAVYFLAAAPANRIARKERPTETYLKCARSVYFMSTSAVLET
jgi:hypothetical protein